MKFKYHFLLSFIILTGCNNSQQNKVIDFNSFEITVPRTWNKLDVKGIDSYVGGFSTNSGDSIFFDYGNHTFKMDLVLKVNDLKEYKKLDSIGFEVNDLIFSKYPNIDQNQGTFHNEYYMYDSIDNYQAKISAPKIIGNGTTGIYFEGLPKGKNLYVYGNNLTDNEHRELLKSFKTIKIK
ncbi:hypothetical protein [Aquimarina brevivitae]|uniref:Uncharacterized protein n=1 Tax=Aquimarina brevivitae TaxID=323412 RepID=A0A4Q7P048_9FLAO|nr:hypothetical protein [Aquimarina brevivitae]RZS93146.1 hypothetical protein EV197_1716 [Aquimarina brevivitae]